MAYEQSTAAGMHDLLDKLRAFLLADGWTINEFSSDSQMYIAYAGLTASGSKRLHVQKDLGPSGDVMTCYFNFRSAERLFLVEDKYGAGTVVNSRYYGETRGIGINGSTGYDGSSGGSNWDKQPGAPEAGATGKNMGSCITELSTTSIAYWFFSVGDSVYVVAAETRTGFYQHMAFGRLTGKGGYTGGMYYSASHSAFIPSFQYWAGFDYHRISYMVDPGMAGNLVGYSLGSALYLTENSIADWRHAGYEGSQTTDYSRYLRPGGYTPYAPPTSSGYFGFASAIPITKTPNTVNALNVMMPCYWLCQNVGGRFFACGYPEGLRFINRTGFNPGDSFVLGDSGGDEWVVFPHHMTLDSDPYSPASDVYPENGIAYQKVT